MFWETITSLLLLLPFATKAVHTAKTKPNFLIIITDQQRWDAIQASGANSIIRTPNIDRLFHEGAYFREAVSPCPVSGPARTSMLTGRFIESTGIKTNMDSEGLLDCPYKSYDQILSENGYIAEYYGKFHSPKNLAFGYSNPSLYGYQGAELIRNWETLYHFYLAEHLDWRPQREGEFYDFSFYNGLQYIPSPIDRRYDKLPSGIMTPAELKMRKLTQPDHHGKLDLSPEHTITAVQGRQTIDAINRLKNQQFIITCSFHCPHSPILPSEPYSSLYNPKRMPVPASINDQMENSPYKSSNGRLLLKEYADSSKIGYMIAEYYASVSEVDEWVGKILDTLDQLHLSQNTVIFFVSDHGEMLGAHGMREKNIFLEESVRVPFAIRYPNGIKTPRIIDTPISAINIFSTIMDYAGIQIPNDGFSLKSIAEGGRTPYNFTISEWNWENQLVPNLMIRTSNWKLLLTLNPDSKSMDALYDIKNDPFEINNLLASEKEIEKHISIALNLKNEALGYLKKVNYKRVLDIENKTIGLQFPKNQKKQ